MATPYLDVMLLPEKELVCRCRELMAEELMLLLLDKKRNPTFASSGGGREDALLLSLHLTRGDVHSHHVHVGCHVYALLCIRVCAHARMNILVQQLVHVYVHVYVYVHAHAFCHAVAHMFAGYHSAGVQTQAHLPLELFHYLLGAQELLLFEADALLEAHRLPMTNGSVVERLYDALPVASKPLALAPSHAA